MGRTGTMSLKTMLNSLGFSTYHMDENIPRPHHGNQWARVADAYHDAQQRLSAAATPTHHLHVRSADEVRERAAMVRMLADDGFDASVDYPACLLYRELMARYPDAKVVLSLRRSGAKWASSVSRTIGRIPALLRRPPLSYLPSLRRGVGTNRWMCKSKVYVYGPYARMQRQRERM